MYDVLDRNLGFKCLFCTLPMSSFSSSTKLKTSSPCSAFLQPPGNALLVTNTFSVFEAVLFFTFSCFIGFDVLKIFMPSFLTAMLFSFNDGLVKCRVNGNLIFFALILHNPVLVHLSGASSLLKCLYEHQ